MIRQNMRILVCLSIMGMMLNSCAALPQLFQATTEIADDTAIKILVSKEAITKETNVNIYVDIENKTPPPPVPKP